MKERTSLHAVIKYCIAFPVKNLHVCCLLPLTFKTLAAKSNVNKTTFSTNILFLGGTMVCNGQFYSQTNSQNSQVTTSIIGMSFRNSNYYDFFSPTKYFFENKNTSTIDWIVTPTDLKIRQHQKRAHEECFTPWRSSNPRREAAIY